MKTKEEIGALIKAKRLEKGLTKNEFAALIGLEDCQRADRPIDAFEQGRTYPPVFRIRLIHKALDIPYEDLLP